MDEQGEYTYIDNMMLYRCHSGRPRVQIQLPILTRSCIVITVPVSKYSSPY